MNSRTPFMLLAILAVVGTLTISSAYAQAGEEEASSILLINTAVSVETDKAEYTQGDIIQVQGRVANIAPGVPVTLTITSPLNAIVSVAQIDIAADATYEVSFNTAGSVWKHSGTYIIDVNYGSAEKSDSVRIGFTGDVPDDRFMPATCSAEEVMIIDECMPGSISGGAITGSSVNEKDKSIVINIDTQDDGTLMVTMTEEVQSGIYAVWVDGEEWDDVIIDGNNVTVEFLAGAEMIEIFGARVIPEFGTIAAMVLAVAIVSIIAVSARSKLSIIPRY